MKQSRFSEQQIAFILQQAEEGTAVEEVCRKAGSAMRPITMAQEVWRADAVGDEAAEAARGRERRLKTLVADLSLDKEMLQDVIRRKL